MLRNSQKYELDEKIIKIAAGQSYEITKEDIKRFEMTDEVLESVAGRKYAKVCIDINRITYISIGINPNIDSR